MKAAVIRSAFTMRPSVMRAAAHGWDVQCWVASQTNADMMASLERRARERGHRTTIIWSPVQGDAVVIP